MGDRGASASTTHPSSGMPNPGASAPIAHLSSGMGDPGASAPTAHSSSGMPDPAPATHPSADRGDSGVFYAADTAVVGGGGRRVVAGWAEEIPLLSASVDVVLSTAVLCSVDDLGVVLAEIRRVLRPGGRFVFLEHVAAPRGSGLRRLQRMIAPITRVVDRGCDPSRDIAPAIEAAFDSVDLSHYTVSGLLKIPFIAGTAHL
jgi:SAM-dependent methyltransferase